MPELPEVQTIVSDLERELKGARIIEVIVEQPRMAVPSSRMLKKAAIGSVIESVSRVAKSIVVKLRRQEMGADHYLVFYLRMTGRLLLRPRGYREDDWVRLVFRIERADGPTTQDRQILELRFAEARMFGYVEVIDEDQLKKHEGRYGPDALSPHLTPEVFLERIKLKRTNIKTALLEQNLIAGVGNIYANDSLWESQIHPETPTQQVTAEQSAALLSSLKKVLGEGIEHRGSTLSDKMYVDIFGREGSHQNFFRVFGKDGQPCPRCAAKIEFLTIGGRGTFFCPHCQVKNKRNSAAIVEEIRLL